MLWFAPGQVSLGGLGLVMTLVAAPGNDGHGSAASVNTSDAAASLRRRCQLLRLRLLVGWIDRGLRTSRMLLPLMCLLGTVCQPILGRCGTPSALFHVCCRAQSQALGLLCGTLLGRMQPQLYTRVGPEQGWAAYLLRP